MNADLSRRAIMLSGVGAAGAAMTTESLAQGAPPAARSVSVTDFMNASQLAQLTADPPTVDCAAAFQAAWDSIQQRGGILVVPPGNYLLASTWRCAVSNPANIMVSGWGARLYASPAVSGFAIEVRGAFNEYMLDIEGLAFDHRGNGTVAGCVEVLGGHCLHLRRCVLEYRSVRRDYRFVRFAAAPGALRRNESRDDRQSFWCKVEGCSIRRRSGDEPGLVGHFAQVVGGANALVFVDNCIQNCAIGIGFEPDPETATLANGVVIDRNFFEDIAEVGIRMTIAPGGYGQTGLRIVHNRFEFCPVALEIVGGDRAKTHSQPPFLFGNYYTAGSVAAVVRNPGNYPVSVLETRYPGFGPPIDNDLYLSGDMTFRFDADKNLHLGGYDGSADWNRGRLYFGHNASMWYQPSDGRLYVNARSPRSGSDGSPLGPPKP